MITTTPASPLTARQAAILAFVVRSMSEHGRPPTIREVVAEFGMRSPNGAQCHLQALVKKGKLRQAHGSARGYLPVYPDGCCPSCGRPIEDNHERSPFSPHR